MVFADIAGLNDTSGNFVDIINCFIVRIIFRHTKQLKMILAFQIEAILDGKGNGVRTLLRSVQKM